MTPRPVSPWREARSIRTAYGGLTIAALAVAIAASALAEPSQPVPDSLCLIGDGRSPIVIEVFSDHQCPACRQFHLRNVQPILAAAAPGAICLIHRSFPLPMHAHARAAARYAEAARRVAPEVRVKVDRALYESQAQWARDGDIEAAVNARLSEEERLALAAALGHPEVEASIEADIEAGRARGVRGTPTIFVTHDGRTRRVPSTVQQPILERYLRFLARR